MKLSCSECQQQLGELINGEVTGETADNADALAHVATCDECRHALALLRAARDEMRSFPTVAVPSDLKARIRAQLATAPTQMAAAPSPPPVEIKRVVPEVSSFTFRNERMQFMDYLQRPSNLAWSGGLVLGLFCIMVLVGPRGGDNIPDLTSLAERPVSRGYYGEPAEDAILKKSEKPAQPKAASPKVPSKPGAPLPRLPGPPTMPPNLLSGGGPGLFPDGVMSGDPSMVIPPAKINQDRKFVAPGAASAVKRDTSPSQSSGNSMADAITKPASPAAPSAPVAAPSPPAIASAPSGPSAHRASEGQGGATSRPDNRAVQSENADARDSAAVMMAPSAPVVRERVRSWPPSRPQAATAKAGVSANAGSSEDRESSPKLMRRQENRPPASRFVVARIVAPRDINWGQLSVVLPEGVRFEDGGKARVLWRGAVGAGENVEVRFTVRAESGSHAIRLSLQEVVKGEAQTLASDSVSVSGR